MLSQWVSILLALVTAGSLYAGQGAAGNYLTPDPQPSSQALSGSYAIVVEAYAWGPGVCQAVLELEEEVLSAQAEQFSVVEEKEQRQKGAASYIRRSQRNVTAAYLSDTLGAPVETPSRYVTLDLECRPDAGTPLCLHPDSSHYDWADPYHLVIELAPGQSLRTQGGTYSALAVLRAPRERRIPQVEAFQQGSFAWGEEEISYAHYEPEDQESLHPLVLWLHGLGEGGVDPTVALLDSNAVNLAGETVQEQLGGAYLLIPQCPTMWMDDGSGHNTTNGTSRYSAALLALLRSYLSAHRGVDPSRVYVGGSSNGGFMTVALLLEAPAAFAAAFPVCETYQDSWLSQEDVSLLSHIPLWFVHSELDQVCRPEQTTFATVERLEQAGAESLRLTRLGEIISEQGGQTYSYNAHFSWVPVLAGAVRDEVSGESLFHWLSRQHTGNAGAET